jgi:hypothetical protein
MVEVDPILTDAEFAKPLPLRGEVLGIGGASAVADGGRGHRSTVTDSRGSLRIFSDHPNETA